MRNSQTEQAYLALYDDGPDSWMRFLDPLLALRNYDHGGDGVLLMRALRNALGGGDWSVETLDAVDWFAVAMRLYQDWDEYEPEDEITRDEAHEYALAENQFRDMTPEQQAEAAKRSADAAVDVLCDGLPHLFVPNPLFKRWGAKP